MIDLTTEEPVWHTDPSLGRAHEPIWLPDGERLFVGGENLAHTVDAATGAVIESLPGHQGGTWSYAAVPGTDWVASAGRADEQTVIFDLGPPILAELGTFPSAFPGVVGINAVGGGSTLAVQDYRNNNGVIDARTGQLIGFRPGRPVPSKRVRGRARESVGHPNRNADWGVRHTRRHIIRCGATFHPTEPKLYAEVAPDLIGMFTLDPDELMQIARPRLSRSLTEEECQLYLRRSCLEDA